MEVIRFGLKMHIDYIVYISGFCEVEDTTNFRVNGVVHVVDITCALRRNHAQ